MYSQFRQNGSGEMSAATGTIIAQKPGDWIYWVATAVLILATATMGYWAPLLSK